MIDYECQKTNSKDLKGDFNMRKAELKEVIRKAVRESKHINLDDTSIFYFMMGYAPKTSIKAIGDAIKEVREEQI